MTDPAYPTVDLHTLGVSFRLPRTTYASPPSATRLPSPDIPDGRRRFFGAPDIPADKSGSTEPSMCSIFAEAGKLTHHESPEFPPNQHYHSKTAGHQVVSGHRPARGKFADNRVSD
jgi:hypothetical protein